MLVLLGVAWMYPVHLWGLNFISYAPLIYLMGGTPIGAPLIGRLGDVAGPRWTIGVGTIAVGLSVVVVGGWLVRRENGSMKIRLWDRR